MDLLHLANPIAVALAIYAGISGLSWLRRATVERAARRRGMSLNLFRRAAPPVAAGLVLASAGAVLGLPFGTDLAAVLIAGGLAFALHRGLADPGRQTWRDHGLRLALTVAFTPFVLWQLAYF